MTDDEVALLIDRCRVEGDAYKESAAVREAAKSFTTAETATALRAVAAAPFPYVSKYIDTAGSLVLALVFANPAPELVTVLREVTPALEPLGRAQAIRVTGQIGTADAFALVIDNLEAFLPDGGLQIGFSGGSLLVGAPARSSGSGLPSPVQLATLPRGQLGGR